MADTHSAVRRQRYDTTSLWHRISEPSFAILRIAAGVLFACHGAQKIFGALGGTEIGDVMSLQGLAGGIELIGGTLIALGLGASWVALVACGEMFVAYFMAHAPKGGAPIQNGGELALLYAFIFLYVAAHGSGVWSVDALIHRPRLGRAAPARR
jgi:putative oxidoreductase